MFHKTVQLSMQIELSIARHMYRQYSLREFESSELFPLPSKYSFVLHRISFYKFFANVNMRFAKK